MALEETKDIIVDDRLLPNRQRVYEEQEDISDCNAVQLERPEERYRTRTPNRVDLRNNE
jgi:hypothetical protein